MGVQARLVNFLPATGTLAANISPFVGAVPPALEYIQGMLGSRVTADNTVAAAPGVTRTQDVALVPSVTAIAQLVVEDGGAIQSVTINLAGLNYTLPPVARAIPQPPAVGRPPSGVGGLLKAFLNVFSTAINQGGGAYDPATATIAFVGGLPPADSNRAFVGCVRQLGIVDPGLGYPVGTTAQIINGGDPTRRARINVTFDGSGRLTSITLLDMGARYTAVPQVAFFTPGGTGPTISAKVGIGMARGTPATATLGFNAGVINAVNVTSPGDGYVRVPVALVDPGGPLGSGFIGTSNMQVGRIDVIAQGTGYVAVLGNTTLTPQMAEYFPTDVQQAKPFRRLQSKFYGQVSISPVIPNPPVIT